MMRCPLHVCFVSVSCVFRLYAYSIVSDVNKVKSLCTKSHAYTCIDASHKVLSIARSTKYITGHEFGLVEAVADLDDRNVHAYDDQTDAHQLLGAVGLYSLSHAHYSSNTDVHDACCFVLVVWITVVSCPHRAYSCCWQRNDNSIMAATTAFTSHADGCTMSNTDVQMSDMLHLALGSCRGIPDALRMHLRSLLDRDAFVACLQGFWS
jgi:hypothetical protein